jgi:hypothetical protein
MTAAELNDKAQEILDGMIGLVSEFQGIRLQADDATWEAATEAKPWLDTICDIEYLVES